MSYTKEQIDILEEGLAKLEKYDALFLKHAQFKEALVREIVGKPLKSKILRKMQREQHAGNTISKSWKKRETAIATDGFVKLTDALSRRS